MTWDALADDDIYPRDERHRYRVYARIGRELTVLFTAPDPGGIGQGLVTFHEDAKAAGRRLADLGRIGVMDVLGGREGKGDWIVLPWDRSGQ